MEALKATNRKQVILAGIETHICVYQTAIELLEQNFEVFIAADAVSSRNPENREHALSALQAAGAQIIPTETILFALLRDAKAPEFKEVLKLVK